jgi:hypothetical protein
VISQSEQDFASKISAGVQRKTRTLTNAKHEVLKECRELHHDNSTDWKSPVELASLSIRMLWTSGLLSMGIYQLIQLCGSTAKGVVSVTTPRDKVARRRPI